MNFLPDFIQFPPPAEFHESINQLIPAFAGMTLRYAQGMSLRQRTENP